MDGKGNRRVWGYGGKGGLERAVSVARTLLDQDFQKSFGSVSALEIWRSLLCRSRSLTRNPFVDTNP